MASCLHASVVLDLFSLIYLFSIKNAPQIKFSSAATISYVYSKWKAVFVNNLKLITIIVKFYHADTFCARLRARLLVCFDRPVGGKQPVKLHLIKLIRLIDLNDDGYI